MRFIRFNLPVILTIAAEISVGILLLVNPEAFTKTIIIIFGILQLIICAGYIVRFLRNRKEGINNFLIPAVAIISFIIGIICTFFSDALIGLIAAIAVIYGIILVISAFYKLQEYFQIKKAGLPVSFMNIISAALAALIGIIIIIYPKDAAFTVWQLSGIALIIEALVDIAALIHSAKLRRTV